MAADGSASAYLEFDKELVVDGFAGAGGASAGIEDAYRAPDVAVNHSRPAIAVHRANHPGTTHFHSDIFEVDPLEATKGRPVGIGWFSPDCCHFSRAKGAKPRSKRIRGLAWVIVRWAYQTRPRICMMENVPEFRTWGPVDDDGRPVKELAGRTFDAFCAVMSRGLAPDHPDLPEILDAIGEWVPKEALVRGLGYTLDFRELVAANYGAPTIRNRLYGIMRCDGRPIVWPDAEFHRNPNRKQKPWRSAAECIDFSNLGKSIFDRKKPLAEASQRRIARGCWKHVLASAKPFIVPLRGTSSAHHSTHPIHDPLSTITGGGTHHGLAAPVLMPTNPGPVNDVAPYLTEFANASTQRTFAADEPLRTQVAQVKGGHFALAAAHLTHLTHQGERPGMACDEPMRTVTGAHRGEIALVGTNLMTIGYGERAGQDARTQPIDAPLGTVVASNKHAMVASHVVKFRGDSIGTAADEPLPTVTAGGNMARPAGAAHALGVASCFLEQANAGPRNAGIAGRSLHNPLSSVVGSGSQQQLVSAYLVKYYRDGGQWQACDDPMHTIPTKARMGLVEVVQVPADLLPPEQMKRARRCARFLRRWLPEHFPAKGQIVLVGDHVLVDITLRMLQPEELKLAQGFRPDYILDRGLFFNPETGQDEWKAITKTEQVKLIGNSVARQVAAALVRANAADLISLYQRMAA